MPEQRSGRGPGRRVAVTVGTVIGVVVLAQLPSAAELAGVALVVAGVALHRAPAVELA